MSKFVKILSNLLTNFCQKMTTLANKTEFPINLRKFILSQILRFRSDVTKAVQFRKKQEIPKA